MWRVRGLSRISLSYNVLPLFSTDASIYVSFSPSYVFPIKELFDKSRSNAIQILIFIFQRQFVYTKADEDKKSFANDFSSFRPRVAAIGKVEKSDAIRGFEKSE